MRFLTTTLLFAITSTITVSALPTSSPSSIYARTDDITSRAAVETFDAVEEDEELEDVAYLLNRDVQLAAGTAEDKRAVIPAPLTASDLAQADAEEEEEDLDDEETRKRDEALLEHKRRATAEDEALAAKVAEDIEIEEWGHVAKREAGLSAAELAAADEAEEDEEGDYKKREAQVEELSAAELAAADEEFEDAEGDYKKREANPQKLSDAELAAADEAEEDEEGDY